jgi:hypothetical protein
MRDAFRAYLAAARTTPMIDPLNIQDYLDATGESAKRVRTITISLVVASVLVMLSMLRFSLSREVDNLKTSFREASRLGQLGEFYVLLSMRQVFTVPLNQTIRRGRFMTWLPKAFAIAPLVVLSAVVIHDGLTITIGDWVSPSHTAASFALETAMLLAVATLSATVLRRMRRVDDVWDSYRPRVHHGLAAKQSVVGPMPGGPRSELPDAREQPRH